MVLFNNNLILEYGYNGTGGTVTFPVTLNNPAGVYINRVYLNGAEINTTIAFLSHWTNPISISVSGFTYSNLSNYLGNNPAYWFAIGY